VPNNLTAKIIGDYYCTVAGGWARPATIGISDGRVILENDNLRDYQANCLHPADSYITPFTRYGRDWETIYIYTYRNTIAIGISYVGNYTSRMVVISRTWYRAGEPNHGIAVRTRRPQSRRSIYRRSWRRTNAFFAHKFTGRLLTTGRLTRANVYVERRECSRPA